MNVIAFSRQMRARGFRYVRLQRGLAHFRRLKVINGREAGTAATVCLEPLSRLDIDPVRLADSHLARSDARFDRLAAQAGAA